MNKKIITKLSVIFLLLSSFVFSSCQVLMVAAEVAGYTEDGIANIDKIVETTVTGIVAVDNIVTSVQKLSPEVEYTIGRATASNILDKYDLYENEEFTQYLNMICKVLTMYSPRPYLYKGYCVGILDTDEINALSTPGGHIFISKGLIKSTTSEDALAAVIAHEISHIQLEHGSNAIVTSRTANALVEAGRAMGSEFVEDVDLLSIDFTKGVDILADFSNGLYDLIINTGYSQNQEFDADNNALVLLQLAGYNPYALVDMLEAIHVDSKSGWGKTHPSPKSRISRVERHLEKDHYIKVDMRSRKSRFNYYMDIL